MQYLDGGTVSGREQACDYFYMQDDYLLYMKRTRRGEYLQNDLQGATLFGEIDDLGLRQSF